MAGSIKVALLVLAVCAVEFCASDSLQVGSSVNAQLAHVDTVKLSAIPLNARKKNFFYNGNQNIKAVLALDMVKGSKAKPSITSGGVGSTFVNVKIKGERGEPINFQIQIYV